MYEKGKIIKELRVKLRETRVGKGGGRKLDKLAIT